MTHPAGCPPCGSLHFLSLLSGCIRIFCCRPHLSPVFVPRLRPSSFVFVLVVVHVSLSGIVTKVLRSFFKSDRPSSLSPVFVPVPRLRPCPPSSSFVPRLRPCPPSSSFVPRLRPSSFVFVLVVAYLPVLRRCVCLPGEFRPVREKTLSVLQEGLQVFADVLYSVQSCCTFGGILWPVDARR